MKPTSSFQRYLRGSLLLLLVPELAGCSVNSEEMGEESIEAVSSALVGQDEFLYLRCNATGWGVDEASRLVATADPYTFQLTYRVSESWMVSSGDQCQLTRTNQLNGWGTQQTSYGLRSGFSPLTVPNSGPLAEGSGNMSVVYPKTGFYTASVNFRSGSISIAQATEAGAAAENADRFYAYLKARFGWLGIDGAGQKAIIGIGMGAENNAQWNQSALLIGKADGVRTDSFAFSRDMIAHELTHAIGTYTSEMRPDAEAGVVNESFADVMAAFSTANGDVVDWKVGETVWTPAIAGDALRRLDDPHSGYNRETLAACQFDANKPFLCGQTAHTREYVNARLSTEHVNQGILNRAAYFLTNGGTNEGVVVRGIGVKKAEQIYFKAFTQHMTKRPTLRHVRYALGLACNELVGQFGITTSDCASIGAAFGSVGIDPPTLNGPSGIGGKVTLAGAPAQVEVILAVSSVGSPAIGNAEILRVTSDASGNYRFSPEALAAALAPPMPQVPVVYQVRYRNPVASDLVRLGSWDTEWFEKVDYATGTVVPTFDIGSPTNFAQSAPVASLPTTFSWTPRSSAREYYLWQGSKGSVQGFSEYSSWLHASPNLLVTSANVGDLGWQFPFGELSGWNVHVRHYSGSGTTNTVAAR